MGVDFGSKTLRRDLRERSALLSASVLGSDGDYSSQTHFEVPHFDVFRAEGPAIDLA